jgi:hypothetical protein
MPILPPFKSILISGRIARFFLLHCVQTGSRDHPASYIMGTGGSAPGSKEAGA